MGQRQTGVATAQKTGVPVSSYKLSEQNYVTDGYDVYHPVTLERIDSASVSVFPSFDIKLTNDSITFDFRDGNPWVVNVRPAKVKVNTFVPRTYIGSGKVMMLCYHDSAKRCLIFDLIKRTWYEKKDYFPVRDKGGHWVSETSWVDFSCRTGRLHNTMWTDEKRVIGTFSDKEQVLFTAKIDPDEPLEAVATTHGSYATNGDARRWINDTRISVSYDHEKYNCVYLTYAGIFYEYDIVTQVQRKWDLKIPKSILWLDRKGCTCVEDGKLKRISFEWVNDEPRVVVREAENNEEDNDETNEMTGLLEQPEGLFLRQRGR